MSPMKYLRRKSFSIPGVSIVLIKHQILKTHIKSNVWQSIMIINISSVPGDEKGITVKTSFSLLVWAFVYSVQN